MSNVFRVHERRSTVTKVDNITLLTTTETSNHLFNLLGDDIVGTVHDTWVDVTLQVNTAIDDIDSLSWVVLINHLDFHTHSLRNNQDVREDDSSVNQAIEMVDWLNGDLRGNLGVTAGLKEVLTGFDLVVLWQVSTSLSHDPHWRSFNLFTCVLCLLVPKAKLEISSDEILDAFSLYVPLAALRIKSFFNGANSDIFGEGEGYKTESELF
ncbi:hypothetical protein WICPIJ_003223 [Wickerhamomyces pijperi]|uniref:Uncharacterized protein n=1 Tax=Wickerhamomyces pijperi TaxID=599730 RepID=A0A9P8QA86_WICPI|nr:hypothetical protein WICPIJ_003223 [Wickerhamomyces pijperi]